jgi:hypothetical protein
MDELHGTQSFAKRQHPDAAVTQSQFGDLVKKVVAEFTALRAELSSLRRRVEQLESKGAKS